jgi:hypothetical protein
MALPARPRRGPRRQCAGVTLIEFALVSPVVFVLVMGIVVGGLVVTNELQLGNVVREGAAPPRCVAASDGRRRRCCLTAGSAPTRRWCPSSPAASTRSLGRWR